MTWLDNETNWFVLTVNPQGHTLRQPATSFEQAWLLAMPPKIPAWSVRAKEEVYQQFRDGGSYVYVAAHTNGTDRLIHRPF